MSIRIRTHPGKILKHEFLEPLGLSVNKLAGDLDVPSSRISNLVNEKREVTVDTAVRLAAYFKTTPGFWLNLQAAHSLSKFQAEQGEEVTASIRYREFEVA